MIQLKIKLDKGAKAPAYQSEGAAGMDISALLSSGDVVLNPHEYKAIPTGVYLEIPAGYEVQVRSRSGLSFKNGIAVLNSPGTVDSDYRGEIKVCLINHSDKPFTIHNGDRIAQLVLARYERAVLSYEDELSSTERGSKGFGSTGV